MAEVLIPAGNHQVKVVDIRGESSQTTGNYNIVLVFEDEKKRRAYRRLWLTERALGGTQRILRTLGWDDPLDAAGLGRLVTEKPLVGKDCWIKQEKKKDKPGELEVTKVWVGSGVTPEEAWASEAAFAVEQAQAARTAKREAPSSEWDHSEEEEPEKATTVVVAAPAPKPPPPPPPVPDKETEDLLKELES